MLTHHKLKAKLSGQTNSVMLLLCTMCLGINTASAAPQNLPTNPAIQPAQQGVEWNNQGFVLSQQGEYAQATALYQRALPLLQANDRRTQLNRAATLSGLGQAQLACQHMQTALQGRTATLGAAHSDTQLSARLLQHIPNCTAL